MRAVFIFLSAFILLSCKKESGGEAIEIYLLKTYQTVGSKCQVESSTAMLQDRPALKNEDIIEYSKSAYEFKLSDAGFQQVKTFTDKTPFAVAVGGRVIYYGFFKPSISSSSCGHSIIMDVAWSTDKKIHLRLGYPGQTTGVPIDDQRNNEGLLSALNKQGKLRP